jgi:imidazoleglycerol-phosphate dehydratase
MIRKARYSRKTSETDIDVALELASGGAVTVDSGVPFFDHMLTSFARHGRFSLDVRCKGDTHIDDHHTVEDIGICLGTALKEALGDKKGIVSLAMPPYPWMTLLPCPLWIFPGVHIFPIRERI